MNVKYSKAMEFIRKEIKLEKSVMENLEKLAASEGRYVKNLMEKILTDYSNKNLVGKK